MCLQVCVCVHVCTKYRRKNPCCLMKYQNVPGLKLVLTCLLSTIRFVELNILSKTISKQVIMHSLPPTVYQTTDNGPQFSSDIFKNYSFDYRTLSSHYPQWLNKSFNQLKFYFKKPSLNRDPYLALLEYRNTPMSDMLGGLLKDSWDFEPSYF